MTTWWCCWSLLHRRADSKRSHVILHEWLAFYSAFLNIHRSGVLTALAWLVPHETAAVSARSLYTIQPYTMSLYAKSYIRKVRAYLAVTCRLHFWQNDRGLLRATAVIIIIKVFLKRKILSLETILSVYTHRHTVTRGWSGYRNKSQHKNKKTKNSSAVTAGIRTRDLSVASPPF